MGFRSLRCLFEDFVRGFGILFRVQGYCLRFRVWASVCFLHRVEDLAFRVEGNPDSYNIDREGVIA